MAEPSGMGPTEARDVIVQLFPPGTADRAVWATDVHSTLELPATQANFYAVRAVTEQGASFHAALTVPGLAAIAWKETVIGPTTSCVAAASVAAVTRAPPVGNAIAAADTAAPARSLQAKFGCSRRADAFGLGAVSATERLCDLR
jgi:hypothetical protein